MAGGAVILEDGKLQVAVLDQHVVLNQRRAAGYETLVEPEPAAHRHGGMDVVVEGAPELDFQP